QRWILAATLCFAIDTAHTEIYTLSLHDALPISGDRLRRARVRLLRHAVPGDRATRPAVGSDRPATNLAHHDGDQRPGLRVDHHRDRKSTRLNSSHDQISYAVFCLKKKNRNQPRA